MKTLVVTIIVLALQGCAVSSPIQSVISSQSAFDGAVYSGELVKIQDTPKGVEEFRVFEQGATGFTDILSLRAITEERASGFCRGKNKTMKPLRERTSQPPHITGNFPRVELIFGCVD